MAKMMIKGLDEYALKLSKLGADAPKIAKKAVMAGANPVADEIRRNLENNLKGSEYSTGDLLDSFGVAPPGIDGRGNTNTKIGFDGYDRKGVPNALKARAMESGASGQTKKPFVRPAVRKMKKKAIEEMGKTIETEIKIYGL
jgi:HK97 gp10 family phage protein